MRRHRSATSRTIVPLLAALVAGCQGAAPSTADVSTGQMLVELSDALNDIRQDNALLQAQIDSLRGEVARQDTVLTRLAAAAGIPR